MLSAIKNFGVTFLIAALIFGLLAYGVTRFVLGTVNDIIDVENDALDEIRQEDNQHTAAIVPEEKEQPEDTLLGSSFDFLMITTDYRPELYNDYQPTIENMYTVDWWSTPTENTLGCLSVGYRQINVTSILLVRVDKEKKQYVYTYFSPETRVYTTSGFHNLNEVYSLYGKETLADFINSMTALSIDYTFVLNGYNFDELTEILGTVTISNPRALYIGPDGGYTTDFETTYDRIGNDGQPWTEHVPNTLYIDAGEVTADGEMLYNLISCKDKSLNDTTANEALAVDVLHGYLDYLGSLEGNGLKVKLAQLITLKTEWVNIDGYVPPEPEIVEEPETTEVEDVDEATEDVENSDENAENADENPEEELPFDITPIGEEEEAEVDGEAAEGEIGEDETSEGETTDEAEESEEAEKEKTDEQVKLWVFPLYEPDDPVLLTDYTMNYFQDVEQLIHSSDEFEHRIITYPGGFKNSENGVFFEADLDEGLPMYYEFRMIGLNGD